MVERPKGDPVKAAQRRPSFFEDPAVDNLVQMNLALAEEVAVLSERIATHEKLLAEKGVISDSEFTGCKLSMEEKQKRIADHQALMERVLRFMREEIDELA